MCLSSRSSTRSTAFRGNTTPSFARVQLTPALQQPMRGEAAAAIVATSPAPPPPRPAGLIEIVLACGVSVRVKAAVNGRALRRVLSALDSR
jgi:hypothetical protein